MPAKEDTAIENSVVYKKPKMYAVIFHNDNYTSMEFVVEVLETVFHKTEQIAFDIMMNVHTTGKGVAGIYTYDIAVTKKLIVEKLAQQQDFPLKLTIDEAME